MARNGTTFDFSRSFSDGDCINYLSSWLAFGPRTAASMPSHSRTFFLGIIPKINAILNSMCDNIVISLGRIEVRFKAGPKLLIEYDKNHSWFTLTNGGLAGDKKRSKASPA